MYRYAPGAGGRVAASDILKDLDLDHKFRLEAGARDRLVRTLGEDCALLEELVNAQRQIAALRTALRLKSERVGELELRLRAEENVLESKPAAREMGTMCNLPRAEKSGFVHRVFGKRGMDFVDSPYLSCELVLTC